MAAVPFVALLTLKGDDGAIIQYHCTASDVNAAAWVWPDAGTSGQFPANHGNLTIVDISLGPATGTDTRTSTIDVNGKRVPIVVLHAANGSTVIGRQFQQSPLQIAAGSKVAFTQVT